LTEKFTDLYKHGQRLNTLCKKFMTEFKKAEERDDDAMLIAWGESLRKATMNCVDVAKIVLAVEEIITGKKTWRSSN